jgi:hypothetical protein
MQRMVVGSTCEQLSNAVRAKKRTRAAKVSPEALRAVAKLHDHHYSLPLKARTERRRVKVLQSEVRQLLPADRRVFAGKRPKGKRGESERARIIKMVAEKIRHTPRRVEACWKEYRAFTRQT